MKGDRRFISILLAVATPVVAWLGLEYLNRPVATTEMDVVLVNARHRAVDAAPEDRMPEAVSIDSQAIPARAAPRVASGATAIKCVRNGRTVYTDKSDGVCDPERAIGLVSTVPAATGVQPVRVVQEEALAQVSGHTQQSTAMGIPPPKSVEHSALCKQLEGQIAWLDSALRQPHSAQLGDHWTAQRRELTDKRYSERC